MCQLCNAHPVYEFTNQRKLCKTCFIRYFQKKFLYIVRKFEMIKQGETIVYKKDSSFQAVVLEVMLNLFAEKTNIKIVKLPKKADKIATSDSLDSESDKIVKEIIKGNASKLEEYLPRDKKIIKPLALFLDEEILLYAKLIGLKFKNEKTKKDKIELFIDSLEQKHPEVKRAVVNSLLELYK